MKTAIYTRVSTDRQTDQSQIVELNEYCLRRGWKDLTEFRDEISGSKFTRKGLDQLMADVRHGRIDCIVCYKLDRLGRSLAHLAQIVSELSNYKVALICTSQGIDTSQDNPAGRLQLGVLMAVAEFEREIIRERVNAGLKAAKRRGKRLGRPNTSRKHLNAVKSLLASGNGVREIARQLSLPLSTVAKLVKECSEAQQAEE